MAGIGLVEKEEGLFLSLVDFNGFKKEHCCMFSLNERMEFGGVGVLL